MKKIISAILVIVMLSCSTGVFALSLDDAYTEFRSLHPEFVNSLLDSGIPEETIISFIYDVYDYIMEINESTRVTKKNFEQHAITAINRVSARQAYHSLQDALIILYPDAIRLAISEGKVDEDFQPLVDTIKRILFDSDLAPSGGGGGGGVGGGGGNERPTPDTDETPTTPPTTAPTNLFSDVADTHWAYTAINELAQNMILNGYLDGTFKPENNITRAEFAKIIVSATDCFDHTATSSFNDVSLDDWHYSYVSTAYKLGYITGYPDGSFHPDDNISRADICTIVNRVLKAAPSSGTVFADDADIPTYAKDAVYALASKEIVNGFSDGSFAPKAYATRAQTAKIIYSAFKELLI